MTDIKLVLLKHSLEAEKSLRDKSTEYREGFCACARQIGEVLDALREEQKKDLEKIAG